MTVITPAGWCNRCLAVLLCDTVMGWCVALCERHTRRAVATCGMTTRAVTGGVRHILYNMTRVVVHWWWIDVTVACGLRLIV